MEMLKSVFRVDEDYSTRRIARKMLGIKDDPDYYEWETHIFFDNCFVFNKEEKEFELNSYVHQLVGLIDKVNTEYHSFKKTIVKWKRKYLKL